MNFKKIKKQITDNKKYFKNNPIVSIGIVIFLVILWILSVIGTGYFDEKGRKIATSSIESTILSNSIELSQGIFFEKEDYFVIEFTLHNPYENGKLINQLDIFLSIHAPETGGGGPLDIDSSYLITFDNDLLEIDKNNLSINNKSYVSYIRNYNMGTKNGLKITIEAPFQILGNSYTPLRINIPKKIATQDIELDTKLGNNSESDDIKNLFNKRDLIKNIEDFEKEIISFDDFSSIYVNIYSGNHKIELNLPINQ